VRRGEEGCQSVGSDDGLRVRGHCLRKRSRVLGAGRAEARARRRL